MISLSPSISNGLQPASLRWFLQWCSQVHGSCRPSSSIRTSCLDSMFPMICDGRSDAKLRETNGYWGSPFFGGADFKPQNSLNGRPTGSPCKLHRTIDLNYKTIAFDKISKMVHVFLHISHVSIWPYLPAIFRSESSKADSHSMASWNQLRDWMADEMSGRMFFKMLDKICVTDVDWMIYQFFLKKMWFVCNLSGACSNMLVAPPRFTCKGWKEDFENWKNFFFHKGGGAVAPSRGRLMGKHGFHGGLVLGSKIQWFEPIKSL